MYMDPFSSKKIHFCFTSSNILLQNTRLFHIFQCYMSSRKLDNKSIHDFQFSKAKKSKSFFIFLFPTVKKTE